MIAYEHASGMKLRAEYIGAESPELPPTPHQIVSTPLGAESA
jgi:hypothetical protein